MSHIQHHHTTGQLSDESLRDTPRRMAAAYAELLTPEPFNATTFPNDGAYDELAPKGGGVVLEAEHTCMSLRGATKPGTRTVTSALHGLVRGDPRTRQEFFSLPGRIAHV
jgi:GTP cyclohydrolase I